MAKMTVFRKIPVGVILLSLLPLCWMIAKAQFQGTYTPLSLLLAKNILVLAGAVLIGIDAHLTRHISIKQDTGFLLKNRIQNLLVFLTFICMTYVMIINVTIRFSQASLSPGLWILLMTLYHFALGTAVISVALQIFPIWFRRKGTEKH